MAEERVQRRLAAILAADVVSYSRLMEQDEAGTLAALKARRKGVLEPLVTAHQGRIVKVMGDGVLVEFGSAVNAVACAVELQNQMAAANEGVADDRRIALRIGINLGDLVSRAATCMETASSSPSGCRRWPSPAGSAFPAACMSSSATSCHWRSPTSDLAR